MKETPRFPAVVAYVPLIGWLFVYALHRRNAPAMYHLRQSIGLVLFLIAALLAWIVVAWVLAWFPYLAGLSAGLFALVMAAYFYGFFLWIMGLTNAFNKQKTPLPGFGQWAERLPVR